MKCTGTEVCFKMSTEEVSYSGFDGGWRIGEIYRRERVPVLENGSKRSDWSSL